MFSVFLWTNTLSINTITIGNLDDCLSRTARELIDMKAEMVQVEKCRTILLVEHFCFLILLQMEFFIRVTGISFFLGFVLTRENKQL